MEDISFCKFTEQENAVEIKPTFKSLLNCYHLFKASTFSALQASYSFFMFPLYLFIMDYSQLLNNCEDKNHVLFALRIPKPDTNHNLNTVDVN